MRHFGNVFQGHGDSENDVIVINGDDKYSYNEQCDIDDGDPQGSAPNSSFANSNPGSHLCIDFQYQLLKKCLSLIPFHYRVVRWDVIAIATTINVRKKCNQILKSTRRQFPQKKYQHRSEVEAKEAGKAEEWANCA